MSDDSRLERIEDKIDSLSERISSVDATLAAQHVTLKDHTRRSLANEESLELLKSQTNIRLTILEKIKDKVYFIGWLLAGALALAEAAHSLGVF